MWTSLVSLKLICFVLFSSAEDLEVLENAARPEEDRITQAEKNKRMQEQLKVRLIVVKLLRDVSCSCVFLGLYFTIYCTHV
jgi:hypothetical protein